MIRNIIIATAMTAATLTTPIAAHASHDRTPPCKYEDGSGQARCVWDARHMGNGQGHSLLMTRHGDKVKVITHKRAHRLMTTRR